MKFIARMIVEVEAESFAVAADHEHQIKGVYQQLRTVYPDCKLEIKQLRSARRAPEVDTHRQRAAGHNGKIAHYAD